MPLDETIQALHDFMDRQIQKQGGIIDKSFDSVCKEGLIMTFVDQETRNCWAYLVTTTRKQYRNGTHPYRAIQLDLTTLREPEEFQRLSMTRDRTNVGVPHVMGNSVSQNYQALALAVRASVHHTLAATLYFSV